MKDEKKFAILDYEQAHEIDPNDKTINRRIGKICFEIAVEKYDQKEYEAATMDFQKAIQYVPTEVKYYLSRARTYYFMEDLENAQIDICICILLEPTNQEIPNIINRIFANQNLNDVLQSDQMKIAKKYLEELRIQNVFDMHEKLKSQTTKKSIIKEEKKKYFHLFPDIKDVEREENSNLAFIEQKKTN